MSKLFFINLKANLTVNQTKDYFETINKNFEIQNNHFVFFINHLSAFLSFNKYNFDLGIQSFFNINLGSHTSCNTLEQIKDFDKLKYCLLGHCEEMEYFNLSLKDINNKISHCLSTNLIPIVCFGDDKLNNEKKTLLTLTKQIDQLLDSITNCKKIILAYEPKYAVNSSFVINPIYVNELFKKLKEYLYKKYNINFKICYGGNVNELNINEFMNQNNIDGFLIGRYGLKEENIKFMKKINND